MKHGLILGEPYRLAGETYVAGLVGGVGQQVADHIVLFDVDDPDDPEAEVDMCYFIDDNGRLWEIDSDPDRSSALTPGTWRGLGLSLVLIETDFTVADLVAEGLDPEVWGSL